MKRRSCILYQNCDATVFLVDIPTSIALAQELSAETQLPPRYLLSSLPLTIPYPPSSEPKTDAARAKVLERIPVSEQTFHAGVEPTVEDALREIRAQRRDSTDWCRLRRVLDESSQVSDRTLQIDSVKLGKRRRRGRCEKLQSDDVAFQDGELESPVDASSGEEVPGLSPSLGDYPPVILSPGMNRFESISEFRNHMVRNTSSEEAIIKIRCTSVEKADSNLEENQYRIFFVPPASSFLLCTLPISQPNVDRQCHSVVPGLPPDRKFNLILLDPPWSNRSVRRSGHYRTQSYLDSEVLTRKICEILRLHFVDNSSILPGAKMPSNPSVAGIWVTNSAKARKTASDAMQGAGFLVCEEWIWIKTTTDGEPITPLGGLWRKPYEVLVIGKKLSPTAINPDGHGQDISRRVIAAVPDIHSRKPNLKEIFEKMFFPGRMASSDPSNGTYSALEVFARNLTAGWWACGDEVLKFNSEEWWVD